MIFTLAWRSLLSHPIRSAVLAGGFGLGVAVMAALLGIGGVILEQARAPQLVGGGDVVVGGVSGKLTSARFVLSSVLGSGPLAPRVLVAAPALRASLYMIDARGATPVRVRGGIPSLERALGDSETREIQSWTDTPADRAWAAPEGASVLRAMDRFHPIPDVPARASSWAEWLYFNGRSNDARFYLTFLAGPRIASGRRVVGVRLQLERGGRTSSYAASLEVEEQALLESAPDLTVGPNRVRLDGQVYRISLDLAAQPGSGRASAEISMHATPGRSLAPIVIRGAGGWVSGYTVPVMSGTLEGSIRVGGDRLDLSGGTGYHDHNWGFWDGVRWQWGQVQGGGLSFVYGRVYPPPDAADASRIPGFLAALGPDGPVGYATDVTIEETSDPATQQPRRIVVRGHGDSLSLTMDLAIEQQTTTKMREGLFGGGLDFLQLRARYVVSGQAGDRAVSFTAPGSAETFRSLKPSFSR
jgi:hypothetical protein